MKFQDNHIAFAKAVAQLARDADLNSFSMNFRPGYHDPCREQIQVAWTQGRHGAEADIFTISAHVQHVLPLTEALK